MELQLYFVRKRDEACKNGEHFISPALSYTERRLHNAVDQVRDVTPALSHTERRLYNAVDQVCDVTPALSHTERRLYNAVDQVYDVTQPAQNYPCAEPHLHDAVCLMRALCSLVAL